MEEKSKKNLLLKNFPMLVVFCISTKIGIKKEYLFSHFHYEEIYYPTSIFLSIHLTD
jgi:hypothetical protein